MKAADPNHPHLSGRATSCAFSWSQFPQPEEEESEKSFNLRFKTTCEVVKWFVIVLSGTHLDDERSCDSIDATSVWNAHDLIVTWQMGRHSLSAHRHIHNTYEDHKLCEDGIATVLAFSCVGECLINMEMKIMVLDELSNSWPQQNLNDET